MWRFRWLWTPLARTNVSAVVQILGLHYTGENSPEDFLQLVPKASCSGRLACDQYLQRQRRC